MATITIDDKVIEYTGNPNLLELAKKHDIDIPHFCYHPALSVSGNCRMCLVEVGTPQRDPKTGELAKDDTGAVKIAFMPKPQPGCYQTASDGMVVRTRSENIIEARKAILEFILANHPLDCPVCDQAGECVLQDYAFQYGFATSRFSEQKRTYKKKKISNVITPEMNRCIHCDRCSRFTTEIAKDHSFARTWRGNCLELATLPGKTITHNYQGNMVDICPVGALTLTDFRFKSRVWFLKFGLTLCSSCGKGCTVMASFKNSKVYRLKPVFNEKVNGYWLCDYGRLRYKFLNENRRDRHMVGGAESTLQAAVDQAASILKSASSVGVIASANETLESCTALSRFFNDVVHSQNVDFRIEEAQIKEDHSLKKGELLWAQDLYPNSRGARQARLLPGNNGITALDLLAGPDRVDALVVVLDDKILEHRERLANLSKAKNLIVFSPFGSGWDARARVSFATRAYTESIGTFINIDGISQGFGPIMPPRGDAADTWAILNMLSDTLGKGLNLKSVEDLRSNR